MGRLAPLLLLALVCCAAAARELPALVPDDKAPAQLAPALAPEVRPTRLQPASAHCCSWGVACGAAAARLPDAALCSPSSCHMRVPPPHQHPQGPAPSEFCALPPDKGPCRAAIPSWWFNATAGACQPFLFGGCRVRWRGCGGAAAPCSSLLARSLGCSCCMHAAPCTTQRPARAHPPPLLPTTLPCAGQRQPLPRC